MGVQWEIDFDYEAFETELYQVSLETFRDIQVNHADETFYMFSLFSTALFDYLYPTANSEEGLTRTAKRYRTNYLEKKPEADISLFDIKLDLRYSPVDSAYHAPKIYDPLFQPINDMLGDHIVLLDKLEEYNIQFVGRDGAWKIDQLIRYKLEVIMLKVMTQLDAQHIFEQTNKRENIVLGLRFGDQSDKEIERYSSMLNPPEVHTKFYDLLQKSYEISREIFDKVYR